MGTDYAKGFPDDGEGPIRAVVISPFAMDVGPVTNSQFADFFRNTGYVTEAEKYEWSFVFWAHLSADRIDQLVEDTVANAPWWCKVPGAMWSRPEGPGSDIRTRADYPVVHVSFNDAIAYSSWVGKQFPAEAEWEYGARGARFVHSRLMVMVSTPISEMCGSGLLIGLTRSNRQM